jgi:hypothetical protein
MHLTNYDTSTAIFCHQVAECPGYSSQLLFRKKIITFAKNSEVGESREKTAQIWSSINFINLLCVLH